MRLPPYARSFILCAMGNRSTHATSAPAHRAWTLFVLAAGVATVGLLLYAPTLRFGFVEWDDPAYVTKNPVIKNTSLAGLSHLWALPHFTRLYHPMTLSVLWALYAVGGVSPLVYHLANAVLHAACSALVVLLTFHLGHRWVAATFAGALFALHPAQVESVAWVSEMKTLLATFFLLTAFYLYVRTADSPPRRMAHYLLYAAAVVAGALGMLSKPAVVVLPALIFLYELCFIQTHKGEPFACKLAAALVRAAPFAAVAGAVVVRTITVYGGTPPRLGGSLWGWMLAVPLVFLKYVQLWTLPARLSALYSEPFPFSGSLPLRVAALAVCLVALGAILRWARRSPAGAFWSGWFIVNFLPVSGAVPFHWVVQDRYLYAMAPGAAALSGMALAALWNRYRRLRHGWVTAACLVGAMLAALSVSQMAKWHDGLALWKHTLPRIVPARPNHEGPFAAHAQVARSKARNYLAGAYWTRGQTEAARRQVEKALSNYAADPEALEMLADYHLLIGRLAPALEYAERARQSAQPTDLRPLIILGAAYGTAGRLEQAEAILLQALEQCRQMPDCSDAFVIYRNLGVLASKQEDLVHACRLFEQAIANNPHDALSRYMYGNVLYDAGRPADALAQWEQAVEADLSHLPSWDRIIVARVMLGDVAGALRACEQSARLAPDDAARWLRYAHVAMQAGRPAVAEAALRNAIASARDEALRAQALQLLERLRAR